MLSPRTYCTPGAPRSAVTIGYVIWSSTMSGLRPIHSVETITCVSERSGMASSGVFRSARTPKPAATMTATRVSARFFAHQAMRRPIMEAPLPFLRRGLESALRRDQKVPRDHYDLSSLEPAHDLVIIPSLCAQGDLPRSEVAIAQ